MKKKATPILVIGGCTTGLTMACELARNGVDVRIIDKSEGIDPHCRANFIHSRTLEVFQDFGVIDEVLADGWKMLGGCLYANGHRFLHSRYHGVDSPFPWGVALPQWRTQEILESLLNSMGVQVERQTELVSMTSHAQGVQATLKHFASRQEVIDTPWLIGCDGAHSTVRHLNQEHFPGEANPHQYVLADVVIDAPIDHQEWHGFFTEQGALYFFLISEQRFLVVANLAEQHHVKTSAPTLDEIQELVTARCPFRVQISDPRWLTYFNINYRLARHYRHNRTFLAGDAAHIHSTIGGHGMNSGIQDAYNLAWKLSHVMHGYAPESLLESYEIERRSVAENLVKSNKKLTEGHENFAHLSSVERQIFCAKMIVPEPELIRMARHEEELDLDYRTSPICLECGDNFVAGPHAGAQALDLESLLVNERTMSLFELLRGPQYTLLIFVGSTEQSQAAMINLLDLVQVTLNSYSDFLNVYLVTSNSDNEFASQHSNIPAIHDPELKLHCRYGAESDCLYLIRPDGYIAYRSRPATLSKLREYLKRVLLR